MKVISRPGDAQLIEGAMRRDRGSRDRLVERHLPGVMSIALRYRNLGLPVDDLVQEGSLGLLDAIDDYALDRGADFESHARSCIRRAMRTALAETSVERGDGARLASLVVDRSTPDPETATVEHEQELEIDHAVDTLPERQRAVVTRHFGFGCEPQEIAEVAASLHVSQQRVRAIERDALYALRDRLQPLPPRARLPGYGKPASGARDHRSELQRPPR